MIFKLRPTAVQIYGGRDFVILVFKNRFFYIIKSKNKRTIISNDTLIVFNC